MSLADGILRRLHRLFTLGPSTPPPRVEPVPTTPRRGASRSTARAVAGVGVAVVLPVAFGALLVPLRDSLSQSISLLMVVPVFVVALVAGARLATIAALSAALTFDVLHTQPFYRLTIDDADDIVETIVLLLIGITAGYLAESAQGSIVAARIRRDELAAVTDFLERIGTSISGDDLAEHAGRSIGRLLEANDCVWLADYRGTASPVLRPDGSLSRLSTSGEMPTGGVLPSTIEIPVGHPPAEHGRFVVRTDHRASISMEERRAAATIAATLGRCLGR